VRAIAVAENVTSGAAVARGCDLPEPAEAAQKSVEIPLSPQKSLRQQAF
jgi:hypothetical protein